MENTGCGGFDRATLNYRSVASSTRKLTNFIIGYVEGKLNGMGDVEGVQLCYDE
jgi:hypothetical protein